MVGKFVWGQIVQDIHIVIQLLFLPEEITSAANICSVREVKRTTQKGILVIIKFSIIDIFRASYKLTQTNQVNVFQRSGFESCSLEKQTIIRIKAIVYFS